MTFNNRDAGQRLFDLDLQSYSALLPCLVRQSQWNGSECLYQHNINCPEPTGRLRYRVELLHPALCCRPCWSFKSAQRWRMRQTERRERKKCSLLIRFCLPSLRRQQSKRGAFSYSWVGGEWQWIKEPCVCVSVCVQCSLALPHTHTHGGAAVSAPA